MNKLFKMLQETFGSAPQRNGFDLSRRDIFSTKVGMKLPVFTLESVPNDYHEIRPVNVVRTLPMNEANFVRMKQHMDFYYVPFTAIQSNFHEVLQQTTDPVNSLMVGDVKQFPMFPLDGLLLAIAYTHWLTVGGNFGYSWTDFLHYVFDQAGDDLIATFTENGASKYADMFLTNFGGLDSEREVAKDMFGNPIYLGAVRLLDMLGYGNYLDLVRPAIHMVDGVEVNDYDQVPVESSLLLILTQSIGKKINLTRLAAYQCIYQHFGINTVYDKLNVYSYNFDDVVVKGGDFYVARVSSGVVDPFEKLYCIFELRYSQWKKDIFTSAYPDSQFGAVSVVSVNFVRGSSLGSMAGNGSDTLQVRDGLLRGQTSTSGTSLATYAYSSQFSILDLRRAEALQGWKEDMMRSGFRSRQRQKSQFGVAPSFDPRSMPYILGSMSSDVNKDVVTGTAGDNFAEQAATGMSTMGNDLIKFDGRGRDDFGIILGIMSIIPEADYDSFGIDLHNIKSEPFDYYTPAFQNIGLQALPGQYLNMLLAGSGGTAIPSIFGYVPRYAEYKQAFDKVHGEFCAFRWSEDDDNYQYLGQFRDYVSTRTDLERNGLNRLGSLYVNPAIVNDIFLAAADGTQSTDQFFVNCYFDVKSVRPMSVLGLPRW